MFHVVPHDDLRRPLGHGFAHAIHKPQLLRHIERLESSRDENSSWRSSSSNISWHKLQLKAHKGP